MSALVRFLRDLYYLFFGLVVKLLGGLRSPKKNYRLAGLLGNIRTRYGYIVSDWSRERYLKTIRVVLPQLNKQEASALLQAYWVNHQKRFLELFLARELTAENIDRIVEFKGLERLDRGLERGKGVILPVPHIGNERLHHIALALKGYPMAVISSRYEDHGPYARNVKLGASKRFHDVGHPGDSGWLLRTLKSNRMLQVSPDAEAGSGGVLVTFLGQNVLLPTGWVRLTLKTGAAVFPSVLLRQTDDRHELVIYPEFEVFHGEDRQAVLRENVQRYMDWVGETFKEHPDLIDWMDLTVRLEETRMSLKHLREIAANQTS